MSIRFSPWLILSLILVSCTSSKADRHAPKDDSQSSPQDALNTASAFAELVLGDRLRTHYTEHVRGNIGVDALFESDELIGYTTFSNDEYQQVSSPTELKDCILFVAHFQDPKSAEWAYHHVKDNSRVSAAEVEGMVGIQPVQVRFIEKIRNDGGGGMFAHQSSYVLFLTELGNVPPITASWKEYENTFLATFSGDEISMSTFKLR